MIKTYKAEFILGLIGSIIGVIAFILSIVFGIVENNLYIESTVTSAIMTGILLLVAFIIGFIGITLLKHNNKRGGIMLVIASGLSLIAMIAELYTAWFAFFTLPLYLTGGIMALSRKPHTPKPALPTQF